MSRDIQWKDITREDWAAMGLCSSSYDDIQEDYPTPKEAYNHHDQPGELMRVVFGLFPLATAGTFLLDVIKPVCVVAIPESIDTINLAHMFLAGKAVPSQMKAILNELETVSNKWDGQRYWAYRSLRNAIKALIGEMQTTDGGDYADLSVYYANKQALEYDYAFGIDQLLRTAVPFELIVSGYMDMKRNKK